jgi:AcrR family transcriptional regulator
MSAEERKVEVVEAAIEEFAAAGLAGASTEAIARRAGISHAYVFRLFPTKRELFLAAVDRAHDHVLDTFKRAADAPPQDESWFKHLGHSYAELIQDRKELLFMFHAWAACGDADIRQKVRERYLEIFDWVRRRTGEDEDAVRLFMATGLLLSVSAAIDAPALGGDGSWSARIREGA